MRAVGAGEGVGEGVGREACRLDSVQYTASAPRLTKAQEKWVLVNILAQDGPPEVQVGCRGCRSCQGLPWRSVGMVDF